MSGLEVNKILASIILAILIIILIGYLSNIIVETEHEENKESAYKIDIPESNLSNMTSIATNEESIESISELLKNASLEKGEKIFKKCGSCHNYKKDSKSKVGPNLWNVINRSKASINGFAYSKALLDLGGSWTFQELNEFLYRPNEYIKGTKMNFSGLKKVEDRANLILWLRQHSDNPATLP